MAKLANIYCKECGSPVSGDVCPKCNTPLNVETKPIEKELEYPTIECEEITLDFWSIGFPIIFAVSFGFFGIFMPIIFVLTTDEGFWQIAPFSIPFALVGIIAFIIAMRPLIRLLILNINGKTIEGTVHGYKDDKSLYINGEVAQTMIILVDTDEGKKYLLYQLNSTKQSYLIDSKLTLIEYKKLYRIKK